MTLDQLKKNSRPLDLTVKSFEGDIYLLFVDRTGENPEAESLVCVETELGLPLKARSLNEMKQYVQNLNMNSCRLVFESPYDEMIGVANNEFSTASAAHQLHW